MNEDIYVTFHRKDHKRDPRDKGTGSYIGDANDGMSEDDDTHYVIAERYNILRKALEKILEPRYGLQGIQEDYGHDTSAYNYHAMKYFSAENQRLAKIARNALKEGE